MRQIDHLARSLILEDLQSARAFDEMRNGGVDGRRLADLQAMLGEWADDLKRITVSDLRRDERDLVEDRVSDIVNNDALLTQSVELDLLQPPDRILDRSYRDFDQGSTEPDPEIDYELPSYDDTFTTQLLPEERRQQLDQLAKSMVLADLQRSDDFNALLEQVSPEELSRLEKQFEGVVAGRASLSLDDLTDAERLYVDRARTEVVDESTLLTQALLDLDDDLDSEIAEEIEQVDDVHLISQYDYLWEHSEWTAHGDLSVAEAAHLVSPQHDPFQDNYYTVLPTNYETSLNDSNNVAHAARLVSPRPGHNTPPPLPPKPVELQFQGPSLPPKPIDLVPPPVPPKIPIERSSADFSPDSVAAAAWSRSPGYVSGEASVGVASSAAPAASGPAAAPTRQAR
ncbi:hypothetical protein FKR81_42765 [Lentzea tibetensis]|uniref:Uncharacterized protein n=1 Tax=Lentzea tibetensis TaxID=2591470 RepID=A0A563EE84_9PSEU|nr:hypothetical protein [Lentzea tibetensis]TWP43216.1 hypothetical protein FKR81_42765 [Lentzea tibetensis]